MRKDPTRTKASQKVLDELLSGIAVNIKTIRTEAKVSQTELSDKVGLCGQKMISDYETETRRPSIHTLHDIAFTLGKKIQITFV